MDQYEFYGLKHPTVNMNVIVYFNPQHIKVQDEGVLLQFIGTPTGVVAVVAVGTGEVIEAPISNIQLCGYDS